ncbi:hypothetical protein ACH5RR_035260 [Cinchona calisaya]|uniref:Uncharacterized protein n=1 Tax=Cinchona calisaya TaxID=153742 RepID=A0ABD2YHB8_9GENT
MSRCFPYPPPGYTLSKASNEALIESIKLQKEREKAKAERKKEKKREKKEKKKAKEEKAKQTKAGHFDHDVYGGESWVNAGVLQKETKDDTEQLERSSITEEHEQPVCLQNLSYSSDSTQNSSKRKRHASPLNGTRVQSHILRIRLPSQKHIQHDIRDSGEQVCSTSGRTDLPPAEPKDDASRADPDKTCSTPASDFIVQGLPLRPIQEFTQQNSFQQPDISSQEIEHPDSGSKRYRKVKRVVERYGDLIENWIPPSQLSEHTEIGDEDWLFGSKHEVKYPEKKVRLNEMSCSSKSSLWPRAHYLHDADVCVLPYTVPF